MPRLRLTARSVAKLRAPHPSGRHTIYWDDGPSALRGFGVLVSGVTTVRSWVAQRDLAGGRTRRITIASLSEMSLPAARERARALLLEMRQGKDPRHRVAGATTLRETYERYLKTRKGLSPRTVATYDHLVGHHLRAWADRELASITPSEVDEMHRRIAADVARGSKKYSGGSVANDAVRCFRTLYNFAARRDDSMPRCPVRLRGAEWHAVAKVRRPIAPERLRDWYSAVQRLPPLGRDYLTLCLFTGLRRREASALRWAEVDFEAGLIRLPKDRAKSGRALDLPMSDVVRDLLVARRALGNAGGYVFAGNGRSGYLQHPHAWLVAVRRATGIDFAVHDLRRTFVTACEAADLSMWAVKGLVNHALGSGVTESYIDMSPERLREPMQRVTDRLKTLCGIEPPRDNVRAMRRR